MILSSIRLCSCSVPNDVLNYVCVDEKKQVGRVHVVVREWWEFFKGVSTSKWPSPNIRLRGRYMRRDTSN